MSFSFSDPEGDLVQPTITVTGYRPQSQWEMDLIADSIQQPNPFGADSFELTPIEEEGGGSDDYECFGEPCNASEFEKAKEKAEELSKTLLHTDSQDPNLFQFELREDFYADLNRNGKHDHGEDRYNAGDIINIYATDAGSAIDTFTDYFNLG